MFIVVIAKIKLYHCSTTGTTNWNVCIGVVKSK